MSTAMPPTATMGHTMRTRKAMLSSRRSSIRQLRLATRSVRQVFVCLVLTFLLSVSVFSVSRSTRASFTVPQSEFPLPEVIESHDSAPPISSASARAPGLESLSHVGTGGMDVARLGVQTSLGTGAWLEDRSQNAPVPLGGTMIALDGSNGSLVLFGGFEGYSFPYHGYNDTWLYQDGLWTKTHPTPSPPPLGSGGFAEDPGTGCDVLFGGIQLTSSYGNYVLLNETWTYCHGVWRNESSIPSPGPSAGFPMVSDPLCGCVVAFGVNNSAYYTNSLWMYRSGGWHYVPTTTRPPARGFSSMSLDLQTRDLVLFGGYGGYGQNDMFNDTWELAFASNGSATWREDAPAHVPPSRYGTSAFQLPGTEGMGIFGGLLAYAPINSSFALNDTWLFERGDWVNVTPAGPSPAPRGEASVLYDPGDNCTVLFGGGRTGGPTFGDTWTFGCQRVIFDEVGLPLNDSWSVKVNQTLFDSTAANVTLYLGPGPYAFADLPILGLPAGERYNRTPAFGTVIVTDTPVEVNITLQLQYEVTVAWQPLIDGRVWAQGDWVFGNGSTRWFDPNATLWLNATPFKGSAFYHWTGNGTGSYTGSLNNATLSVGSPINETAVFGPQVKYSVTFAERGLPGGVSWTVILAGRASSTYAPTVDFELANGSYTWSARTADSVYSPSVAPGEIVVDGNASTISVNFSQKPTTPASWGAFPFLGVEVPLWAILLIAVTTCLVLIGLTRRRRRRNRAF